MVFRRCGGWEAATPFFLLGGYTLLLQVILLRECFALFAGNELSVALQLGLWLGFTALGGVLGANASGRYVPWLLVGLPFAGVASVVLVRVLPVLVPAPLGQEIPLGWALLCVAAAQAPLNLTAGILFPSACRRLGGGDATRIGAYYLFEALGAAFAGCLFTFLLAGHVRAITVALAGSGLMALAAGIIGSRGARLVGVGGGAALLVMLALRPADRLDDLWWNARYPGTQRAATVETPYQRLDLALRDGQFAVFSNGVLSSVLGENEDLARGERGADLYMTLGAAPRRVLVVGSGEPALPSRILEYPIESLTYTLQDPALKGLLWMPAPVWANPKVSVLPVDGRNFLNACTETFDMIILDLPAPLAASSNRFFTIEAFASAARCLAQDGCLVFALPSSSHYLAGDQQRFLASVYLALEAAFGTQERFYEAASYVSILAGDSMVFIARPPVRGDGSTPNRFAKPLLEDLARRFGQSHVPLRLAEGRAIEDGSEKEIAFTALYEPLFEPFRASQQIDMLEKTAALPNSDLQPIAYYLNLRRWMREFGHTPLARTLEAVEGIVAACRNHAPWIITALVSLSLIFGILLRRHSRLRPAVVAGAMLTSGGFGMIGQVALLFLYQNAFGQLYRAMGALFAAYMLGLVTGSGVTTRWCAVSGRRLPAIMAARAFMAAACIAAILLASTGSAWALFAAVFAHAFALGAEYPPANALYFHDYRGRRAAGVLHAMDHFGGALAALVGGIAVLPFLGPYGTLAALAALHAAVLAVLGTALTRTET